MKTVLKPGKFLIREHDLPIVRDCRFFQWKGIRLCVHKAVDGSCFRISEPMSGLGVPQTYGHNAPACLKTLDDVLARNGIKSIRSVIKKAPKWTKKQLLMLAKAEGQK